MNLNEWHLKSGVSRYVLAFVLFCSALITRFLVLPIEAGYAFVTFYPLTALAFYLCGTGPGAVSYTHLTLPTIYSV